GGRDVQGSAGVQTRPGLRRPRSDWNCRSRASGSESGGRRPSNNDIDVAVQKLGDEAGFLCERAFRPAYVNGQVLPFGPAALLERFAKGAKHRRERRHRPDHGYAPNPTSLLRPRRHRPCGRTAEQRYELAPLHSITSSTVASSCAGTSRPSALAVCILMMNSNLVDCTTGRSAGFAPLMILPV